jgi:hypothetical protein
LFDKPITQTSVIEKNQIEAEILGFL